MTCQDCVHYEACKFIMCRYSDYELNPYGFACVNFKDKTEFIELPCRVGDKVFKIKNGKIEQDKVYRITIDVFGVVSIKLQWEFKSFEQKEFGKTVFLTKEEAEEALKECGENVL